MARASALVTADADGWVLHLGNGGEGRRLRSRPPPAEADVVVAQLLDPAALGEGGALPGVDAQGNLIPYFPQGAPGGVAGSLGDGPAAPAGAAPAGGAPPAPATRPQHTEQQQQQHAEQQQQQPAPQPAAGTEAVALAPVAPPTQGTSASPPAETRPAAGGAPPDSAPQPAALDASAAAALAAAPPRKRIRKAGELRDGRSSSPERDGTPAPSPTAADDIGGGGGGRSVSGSRPPEILPVPSSSMADDDEEGEEEEGGEEESAEKQQFDTQCALCDDGGLVLACDGPCMRSFHTNQHCNLLGLPEDLAAALAATSETFRCPNCLAGVQQCYVCKREGRESEQVFKCIHASCGRHYHPACVGADPGQPFACKLHTCKKCGGGAGSGDQPSSSGSKEGQLVPCRRCPLAYHRRCLPGPEVLPRCRAGAEGARVWFADYDEQQDKWLDGVESSLMYCPRHELDPATGQALFTREVRKAQGGGVRQRPYLLIREDLQRAALAHYARQFRHLASSRALLAEEAEAERKRARAAAPAARAGSESGSDDDIPLAVKRQRLASKTKAGSSAKAAKGKAAAQPWAKAAGKPAAAAAAAAPSKPDIHIPKRSELPALPAQQQQQQQQRGAHAAAAAAAGEASESSAATEDVMGAGGGAGAGEPEVTQAAAAGSGAAARVRPAHKGDRRAKSKRLQEALDALVRLPSQERRHQRLTALLRNAENDARFTKDAVWRATRRPEPYAHPMKKTIDEGTLRSLERSVAYAASARLPTHELMAVIDGPSLKRALGRYDDLLMVLAPYLHGARYSSYGRHFTQQRLLHRVAERLALFLRPGDQVVDFSCGENYFLPHLKRLCLEQGIPITGRAYDIILAKDRTDFVLKSWFDVRPGDREAEGLAPAKQLVVGLNPPFGKNNSLADKFVRHAAALQPRLFVLIVPPRTVIPPGYKVVLENAQMCGGEEFYVPGSKHLSWNKEWPVLRVLMRVEEQPQLAGRGDPNQFAELLDCSHAALQAQQAQQYLPHGAAQQQHAYGGPGGWY